MHILLVQICTITSRFCTHLILIINYIAPKNIVPQFHKSTCLLFILVKIIICSLHFEHVYCSHFNGQIARAVPTLPRADKGASCSEHVHTYVL